MPDVKLNVMVEKPGNIKEGKMPFNKRKWRKEKYSIKAKVKKVEEKRKRTMLLKYQKELKKSGMDVDGKNLRENNSKTALSSFKKAHFQYKRIQEEKQRKKEEMERIKREKEEAIKAYKEKKAAKFKKLSQKTKKGQPVMKGRIELLLEKIEKNYAQQSTLK